MKENLLKVLRCPECKAELRLWVLATIDVGSGDAEEGGAPPPEVAVGLLQCTAEPRHLYPIRNGIPQMLAGAVAGLRAETGAVLEKLPADVRDLLDALAAGQAADLPKEVRHVQESFTAEWAALKGPATPWGQDVDARRELFHQCVGLRAEDLPGRRVLDAGCGHGEVELALLETGAEIFAVDLSSSVDIVQDRLRAARPELAGRCHVIQGDVHKLPFKDEVFDVGHSAGVLHHTPDTRAGLAELSRTVRPGGTCFIEVYSCDHKNALEKTLYHAEEVVRKLTVRLPHRLLHGICYAGAPALWAFVAAANAVSRQGRYIRRTLGELELALFDSLSPMFDWHHSTEEVKAWFRALGYANVRKSFFNHNVIGIVGTKRATAGGRG